MYTLSTHKDHLFAENLFVKYYIKFRMIRHDILDLQEQVYA
jgi:hypothetical protein